MTEASNKDFVVIDTTSGIQAINKGAPYKIMATLTFGNFFIASTGHDANNTMDAGDKIVLFNQNATPDLLFHYLYGNTYDAGIEYVANVQDAAKCLITSKNAVTGSDIDYVFIAQPVLLNALAKNANAAKYADIQEEYSKKSNGKKVIQASLFIKNSLDRAMGGQFTKDLESNIVALKNNPDLALDILNDMTSEEATSVYGVAPSLAVQALKDNNGLGLGFEYASYIKEDIDAFLKDIQGLDETSKEIYW